MSQKLKRAAAAVTLTVFVVAAVGCQSYNDARGKGDAPIGKYDDAPVFVRNNADGFMNISFMCIGENGVYSHTREAAPSVVASDPNCAEGGFFDDLGLLGSKVKDVRPEGED